MRKSSREILQPPSPESLWIQTPESLPTKFLPLRRTHCQVVSVNVVSALAETGTLLVEADVSVVVVVKLPYAFSAQS